jgi:hypothetical protein
MLPVAATLALAACASPEVRIAQRLMDYGLSRSTAGCMADQLEDRLSNRQLKTLASLASDITREGRSVRDMTVRELAERVRRTGDPELFAVLTRAGVGCAVLGGDGLGF